MPHREKKNSFQLKEFAQQHPSGKLGFKPRVFWIWSVCFFQNDSMFFYLGIWLPASIPSAGLGSDVTSFMQISFLLKSKSSLVLGTCPLSVTFHVVLELLLTVSQLDHKPQWVKSLSSSLLHALYWAGSP